MLRAFAVACGFLLAGCAGASQQAGDADQLPDQLPSDWDSGVPLQPYQRGGYHNGGRAAALHPTQDLEQPAACAAYRDDARDSRDTCTLRETRYAWENRSAWVAEAGWAGCPGGDFTGCPDGSARAAFAQRVVAFDAQGRAVAWWNGTDASWTQHWTE